MEPYGQKLPAGQITGTDVPIREVDSNEQPVIRILTQNIPDEYAGDARF